jgi:uncharacterized C2H2 Zn-finger protein
MEEPTHEVESEAEAVAITQEKPVPKKRGRKRKVVKEGEEAAATSNKEGDTTPGEIIKCPKCRRTFKSIRGFNIHTTKMHGEEEEGRGEDEEDEEEEEEEGEENGEEGEGGRNDVATKKSKKTSSSTSSSSVETPRSSASQVPSYRIEMSIVKAKVQFLVASDLTFDAAFEQMLDKIDFDFDHLYTATITNNAGSKRINSPLVEDTDIYDHPKPISGDKIKMSGLRLERNDVVKVLYDFGDEWDITLKMLEERQGPSQTVTMLKSRGAIPQQY